MKEEPYLFEEIVVKRRKYNPEYGDDHICQCGHTYINHFENYVPLTCNQCECYVFQILEEEMNVR